MCSVNSARHHIPHVIQEIKFVDNKMENLKLYTCLTVCVHYSLSTPLLRRLQYKLTSSIFSLDRALFLYLQTPSKHVSVLLFHVQVYRTILKPLTMISTLQLEIQCKLCS